MRNSFLLRNGGGIVAAFAGIFCLLHISPAVAGGETNALLAKAEPPKSAFVDDPKAGRDPFFPRSTRRMEKLPTPVVANAPAQPAPTVVQCKLRGISGTTNRKIALINNRTFEAGEEGEVRTNDGKVRIRCVQVNESSVVIMIGGQRRELFLGDAPETSAPAAGSSAKL